jgi:hypothetical protein
MQSKTITRLKLVHLSPKDTGDIFSLYEHVRSCTQYGFLADRSEQQFNSLLSVPENVIGLGLRDAGRLIAYSICHRTTGNPYTKNSFLGPIDPNRSTTYHGDGTVVDPAYAGRHLGKRLFRLRVSEMSHRGIEHMISLVAIDNMASIGNALLAGALLVGTAPDPTAINYILYVGTFRDRLDRSARSVDVSSERHEEIMLLFEKGYLAYGLGRAVPGTKGRHFLRLLPMKAPPE